MQFITLILCSIFFILMSTLAWLYMKSDERMFSVMLLLSVVGFIITTSIHILVYDSNNIRILAF